MNATVRIIVEYSKLFLKTVIDTIYSDAIATIGITITQSRILFNYIL